MRKLILSALLILAFTGCTVLTVTFDGRGVNVNFPIATYEWLDPTPTQEVLRIVVNTSDSRYRIREDYSVNGAFYGWFDPGDEFEYAGFTVEGDGLEWHGLNISGDTKYVAASCCEIRP